MTSPDVKGELHGYLRGARETLVWKLDGLGEHDARRPLTPTGTNLLGLVKHSAASHLRYFGDVFDRTGDLSLPWTSLDAEPNAEMWAAHDEDRDEILDLYHRTWRLADATITELPLERSARCRGGATARSPSSGSSSTSRPRPSATPATPTSSASSSTGRPVSSRATPTCVSAMLRTGPRSATGSMSRPASPPRGDIPAR